MQNVVCLCTASQQKCTEQQKSWKNLACVENPTSATSDIDKQLVKDHFENVLLCSVQLTVFYYVPSLAKEMFAF